MPSIKYAHICEYARIDQNGSVSIIGIFNTIHVPGVPANFPFFHVISNLSGQNGEKFQFMTRISNPDGSILRSAPESDILIHQEDENVNQINGYIGLVLPMFGDYSVELLIDGTVVHSIPFRVIQRTQW